MQLFNFKDKSLLKIINKTSQLSLVTIFIILGFYFFRSHPLTTNDTYYHMAVGREAVKTWQIPYKDNFVFGSKNTDYVSAEWLSGVIFYLIAEKLNIELLFVLRVACGLLSLLILYKAIRLFTTNYPLIFFAVLTVGYILPFRLSTRPEMFSLVIFSLLNYVLLKNYFNKKISTLTYFFPLIFLLWPNLHGLSPIGFFQYTFFTLISYYRYKQKKILFIYFLSLALYVPQYKLILSFLHANNFSKYITEFISLWDRIFPSPDFARFFPGVTAEIYIFLLFISLFGLLLFLNNKKLNKNISLPLAFYLIILMLPFKFFRLITPIMVVVFPYAVYLLERIKLNIHKSTFIILNTVLILILLMSIAAGYTIGGMRYFELYPTDTIRVIKSDLSSKRLFTIYFWNDYYIWNIPTLRTYADVMTQYRTDEDTRDEKILHSPKNDIQKLLQKYDIDTIVTTRQKAARIIGVSSPNVSNLQNWRLVYIDNTSSVYARQDVIKPTALDLSAIKPEINGTLKFKPEDEEKAIKQLNSLLKSNAKNDFAWEQLIFYHYNVKKDLQEAKVLTQNAINVLPDEAIFNFILAALYLQENNCEDALIYAKSAQQKNLNNKNLDKSIKTILQKCI